MAPQIWPEPKCQSFAEALLDLEKNDLDGRDDSATSVLTHIFGTLMSLQKLWVVMSCLLPPQLTASPLWHGASDLA